MEKAFLKTINSLKREIECLEFWNKENEKFINFLVNKNIELLRFEEKIMKQLQQKQKEVKNE